MALAVRAGKPIMAHDSPLAHARVASNPPDGTLGSAAPEPDTTVQDWLDWVQPGDFEEGSRR